MKTGTRLGLFALGLALIFGAAVGVGSSVEPAEISSDPARPERDHEPMGDDDEMKKHGGHEEASAPPAGLAIAEAGYSVRLERAFFDSGKPGALRFSIVDGHGETVTEFDETHDRKMHLIVVRRDGTAFRHLHPEMDRAGTWTAAVGFDDPGVYRAFADFSAEGDSRTLATDLFVNGGSFQAEPFPEPSSSDATAGYVVELHEHDALAGRTASLSFTVERDGHTVDDLEPYLGAKGHLVALREGDLAFLHVHPEESHGHGGEIAFGAAFPTPGRYRLYLQFKHEGAVRTAQFTVAVGR